MPIVLVEPRARRLTALPCLIEPCQREIAEGGIGCGLGRAGVDLPGLLDRRQRLAKAARVIVGFREREMRPETGGVQSDCAPRCGDRNLGARRQAVVRGGLCLHLRTARRQFQGARVLRRGRREIEKPGGAHHTQREMRLGKPRREYDGPLGGTARLLPYTRARAGCGYQG